MPDLPSSKQLSFPWANVYIVIQLTSPKGVFLDGVSGPMNHAHTSSLVFEMLSKHSSGAIGYESRHDWGTDQLGTRYTVFALFENILQ